MAVQILTPAERQRGGEAFLSEVRGVSTSGPNPSGKQATDGGRPPREPKENVRVEFFQMDSSGHTEDARQDKRAPDVENVNVVV